MLDNFDEHLDNILERNEKDFLTAYRGHMLKVQKELEYFKAKTSEQEFRMKMDEHVQKIEKSLEWFRSEALNLGTQMNEFKAEAQKWKSKWYYISIVHIINPHKIRNSLLWYIFS